MGFISCNEVSPFLIKGRSGAIGIPGSPGQEVKCLIIIISTPTENEINKILHTLYRAHQVLEGCQVFQEPLVKL